MPSFEPLQAAIKIRNVAIAHTAKHGSYHDTFVLPPGHRNYGGKPPPRFSGDVGWNDGFWWPGSP